MQSHSEWIVFELVIDILYQLDVQTIQELLWVTVLLNSESSYKLYYFCKHVMETSQKDYIIYISNYDS